MSRSIIRSSWTLHLLTLLALLLLTIASVAALVWSSLRNIIGTWQIRHAKHPKSRRGRYCFVCLFVFVVVDDKRERQNIARAYGTGVGARRGHWFNIAIMLLLVIRHPTCASCVAWMCCRMSNSIKHVWACPNLSSRRRHRYLLQSCCC
jgi:hypothetical protein